MIPRAEDRPLLRPAELLELHPDLKRSALYEAIRRGEIPSLQVGARVYIPTAKLRRLLGLDMDEAAAPTAANVTTDLATRQGAESCAG